MWHYWRWDGRCSLIGDGMVGVVLSEMGMMGVVLLVGRCGISRV